MTAAVEIAGLRHRYGERVALDGTDLTVAPAEIFGILGPNGSGKSTLFRVLSTLIPPQEGAAVILGLDVGREARAVRKQIGVVFQSPAVDRMLTASENLRHQGHLYGLTGADLQRRIERSLDSVGMLADAPRRVSELSGGQRRRVELAKALLHQPKVLILDEPSTGVDPAARIDFWKSLRALQSTGTTILLTTHLMDEGEQCSRLAILDRGRVVAIGTADALRGRVGGDVISVTADNPSAAVARLRSALPAVDWIEVHDGVRAQAPAAAQLLPGVAQCLGEGMRSIHLSRPTLQDVFLSVTGRRFDDRD